MKKLKIVVTGSKGYIGSEVVFRLKMLGFDPIEIDLKDRKNVLKDMPKCDVAIHCASRMDNKKDVIQYNVDITQAVLKKAEKIVFLSSAAVYGDIALGEEGDLLFPANLYGESKVLCEKLIKKLKISYAIFRLSNVYSFHADHGVIAEWLKGGRMINNQGEQMRDFVRLEDIVPVIVEAAITNKWKGVYNLSSGMGVKIIDLFKRFFPNEKPEFKEKKEHEISYSILNSNKAQTKGFLPL